jgi:hypothetical protein
MRGPAQCRGGFFLVGIASAMTEKGDHIDIGYINIKKAWLWSMKKYDRTSGVLIKKSIEI